MKVTGLIVALVAAAPMVAAVPFRLSDIITPVVARAPEPVQQQAEKTFPQYRSLNLTTRDVNASARPFHGALLEKRAFIPDAVVPRNITKA